jgi:hypothetical protein
MRKERVQVKIDTTQHFVTRTISLRQRINEPVGVLS